MELRIKKLRGEARIPVYAREGDAGFDLHSCDEFILRAGERKLIPTGLAFEIPTGYEMQIRPKSGLASKHGISIVNSPATIDSGYRGDVGIILINHGHEDFIVKSGDKIAQGVLHKFESAEFLEVEELSESERGEGGFGSSGK